MASLPNQRPSATSRKHVRCFLHAGLVTRCIGCNLSPGYSARMDSGTLFRPGTDVSLGWLHCSRAGRFATVVNLCNISIGYLRHLCYNAITFCGIVDLHDAPIIAYPPLPAGRIRPDGEQSFHAFPSAPPTISFLERSVERDPRLQRFGQVLQPGPSFCYDAAISSS